MTRWQDDKPRAHHYEVAHRALPGVALNPAVDLRGLATSGRLDEALRATWAAVGERQADVDRLDDEGLHGEIVDTIGTPAALLTFPVALHATEAFFAVVAPLEPPESRRYITLESSWNVITQERATVIGEWRADGHYNLGPGPEATMSAFLESVEKLLS